MTSQIGFLSDFGLADHYVGVVHAVFAELCPEAHVLDITHGVPPGDVLAAAYYVKASYPWLPEGSVLLAVVDPGVGTDRPLVAIRAGGRVFVGPDNGIFSYIVRRYPLAKAIVIDSARVARGAVSQTFHGRDILAPGVAAIVNGASLRSLGVSASDLCVLPETVPVRDGDTLKGAVLCVDRFGNCITSVQEEHLAGAVPLEARCGNAVARHFMGCYAQAVSDQPVCLIGSAGHLEFAVSGGSAARQFGIHPGDPVAIVFSR